MNSIAKNAANSYQKASSRSTDSTATMNKIASIVTKKSLNPSSTHTRSCAGKIPQPKLSGNNSPAPQMKLIPPMKKSIKWMRTTITTKNKKNLSVLNLDRGGLPQTKRKFIPKRRKESHQEKAPFIIDLEGSTVCLNRPHKKTSIKNTGEPTMNHSA
jgi:hypothetical protein